MSRTHRGRAATHKGRVAGLVASEQRPGSPNPVDNSAEPDIFTPMSGFDFIKMHGLRNDFVVLDAAVDAFMRIRHADGGPVATAFHGTLDPFAG